MTTNAASPAQNEDALRNGQPQGEAATPGENWQQQLEDLLQPAVASIQQQVAQAAEQQFEPLRSRIRQLAGQQQDGDARQQAASPAQSLAPAPAAEAPSQPAAERETALQRWGGTLEDLALIVLAVGEVLDGIALILQAMDEWLPPRPSAQSAQGGESSPQEGQEQGEEKEGEEEGGESLFLKPGHVFAAVASTLRQTVSHLTGNSSAQRGVESALASLPQWGQILEHASALLQALGDSSSSGQDGMKKWGPIIKHGAPLVKELGQVLGGSILPQPGAQGDGNVQRWGKILGRAASVLEALGDGSPQKQDERASSEQEREGDSPSSQEQDSGSSSTQKGGGLSSALQSLAGGSSSQKKDDGGGSSLIDALTGESSPLQMLREFSKRQQGPGGLAPKGPVGRKPPPGPLRRDRLPGAK